MERLKRFLRLETLEAREVPALIGGLDPSFSPNAPAGVTDVVAGRQFIGVAVQQDGKLVAISDQTNDFFITRYNPDGSLDTTFGLAGTGVVQVDVGGALQVDHARGVAIDAQNRIVVVGSGGAAVPTFALVRLSADGKTVQLNKAFADVANPADPDNARAVAFQTDGTIVIAGDAKNGGDSDFVLLRVDPTSGTQIGAAQFSTFPPGGANETGNGVAVYQSGPNVNKIVIVGTTNNAGAIDIAISQRNPDGTADNTFVGLGGRKVIDVSGNDNAAGVAITASGSIVVAGNNGAADNDLVVAQLLPTGAFDPTFNGGAVRTIIKTGNDSVNNQPLALQRDGKIVVVGDSNNNLDVGVFRLNADGSIDTSFGPGGARTFDVNGNDDANAVAIDPNGRIVIAGDDNASAGFLARIIGTVERPPSAIVGGSLDGRATEFFPNAAGTFGSTPVVTPAGIFPGFTGNVRSTTGDVNGDGFPDAILVTGPGTPIRFAVISGVDGTTVLVPPTAPFVGSETFNGGGFVAAADLDNDGRAEFIFTPDQGGGPRVTVYSLVGTTPTVRANFFGIADAEFRGGARIAAGDINADGFADLAVAAGFQGGPRVELISGATVFTTQARLIPPFFVFPDVLRNGVFVAIGDINGDGFGDLIVGAGPGGGPVLKSFDGKNLLASGAIDANRLGEFFVGGTDSDRSGVRVATVNADGDNKADVAVGTGGGVAARVKVYLGKNFSGLGEPTTSQSLTVFGGTALTDGIFVG